MLLHLLRLLRIILLSNRALCWLTGRLRRAREILIALDKGGHRFQALCCKLSKRLWIRVFDVGRSEYSFRQFGDEISVYFSLL